MSVQIAEQNRTAVFPFGVRSQKMWQLFRWRVLRRSQLEEEMSYLQRSVRLTQPRDIAHPGLQPFFIIIECAIKRSQYRFGIRSQTATLIFNDQAGISLLL